MSRLSSFNFNINDVFIVGSINQAVAGTGTTAVNGPVFAQSGQVRLNNNIADVNQNIDATGNLIDDAATEFNIDAAATDHHCRDQFGDASGAIQLGTTDGRIIVNGDLTSTGAANLGVGSDGGATGSLLVRPMAKSKLVVIFPACGASTMQAAMVALLAPLMFRPSTPPLQSTAQPSLLLVVSLKKALLVFKVLAARLRLLPLFRLERRRHRLALVPQSETLFSTEHLIPPLLRILN